MLIIKQKCPKIRFENSRLSNDAVEYDIIRLLLKDLVLEELFPLPVDAVGFVESLVNYILCI